MAIYGEIQLQIMEYLLMSILSWHYRIASEI